MKLFNESLTMRYNTLEGNVKSESNSFYDSYLDLLEATIKFFLDENNIKYDDSRTCGHLVKNEKSVKKFLLNTLKLDDYTYNKLPDYIKKCNDHKHKKEKTLSIESVINYLKVYFDLINYYNDFINEKRIEFDANYYKSIFGETERINKEYKEKVVSLKDELKAAYDLNKMSKQDIKLYKELVSIKEIELMNLDEQNAALQKQIMILQDIKINSLEGKVYNIADNLHELVDTFNDNKIVKKVIKDNNLDFGPYNHNDTINDISKSVANTKKVIDNTNKAIKKTKDGLEIANDVISFLSDIINNK